MSYQCTLCLIDRDEDPDDKLPASFAAGMLTGVAAFSNPDHLDKVLHSFCENHRVEAAEQIETLMTTYEEKFGIPRPRIRKH